MKKGDKIINIHNPCIGEITRVIRKDGVPVKIYVRHNNYRKPFVYSPHNIKLI